MGLDMVVLDDVGIRPTDRPSGYKPKKYTGVAILKKKSGSRLYVIPYVNGLKYLSLIVFTLYRLFSWSTSMTLHSSIMKVGFSWPSSPLVIPKAVK